MSLNEKNRDFFQHPIHSKTPGNNGNLKIFFSYAPGTGKTHAMLLAAHQAKKQGIDVVAGYIKTDSSSQTAALLCDLEQLPFQSFQHGEFHFHEFDLDGALKRNPQLILVDQLAHVNQEGCRHAKRYQDIQELLKAGINVYTTLDVQHIESLNDMIVSITNIPPSERIPDFIFDQANQVEFIDIEPEKLFQRLKQESIPQGQSAAYEDARYLTITNLTALRAIALRRCADKVSIFSEYTHTQKQTGYYTDEHILVCLSSSPSNAKIIRTAARMAKAFQGTFTALFVETPGYAKMGDADKKRLQENIRLAQQLGAMIETIHGNDVPYQISEFARLSSVSKIVIGRSTATRKSIFSKPPLTEQLIAAAPNLDIHIIPDASIESHYQEQKRKLSSPVLISAQDMGKSILVLLASIWLSYLFYLLGFTESNLIAVFIFGVLVISVITTNRLCGFLSSIVSVLGFNFFFTNPRFTFHFYDPDYLVTFTIMFMVSFLTGSLAAKLKDNAKQSAYAAFRTKILFETSQLLQKEQDEPAVLSATAEQLTKLLKRDLVIYSSNGSELSAPTIYYTEGSRQSDLITEQEKNAAAWVFQNNHHAGATTDTLSNVKCLYLAIRINQHVYGVVGIAMNDTLLDSFENSVLLSILGECALALENIKNAREKEETAILARNEQLRANLLRAISHDLRTPLTSISGNASTLLSNDKKLDDITRIRIFTDIYDDSMWLISLVENLLAVTRIEEGRMNLKPSAELIEEVIAEALRHVNRKSKGHIILNDSTQELVLAQIDAKLVVQVMINLIDNAVKYTPAGSVIKIHSEQTGKWVIVSVSDNGPGIPDEQKPLIFNMFYSGANKIADSRRSLGLGLFLCKAIITAHGGSIFVADNQPHGAVFQFTLPAEEVKLYE